MSDSFKNVRLYPWRDGSDHCLKQLLTPSSHLPIKLSTRRRQLTVSSIRNGQYTYKDEDSSPLAETSDTATLSTTITLSPIENVDVCLDPTDSSSIYCHQDDISRLFDAIAQLPHLSSFMVRFKPSPGGAYPHSFPRGLFLSALTHVLSNAPSLHYFTLIGIPLHDASNAKFFSDNDLDWDMNGFLEVLRIHPGLQSVGMKDCSFATDSHWKKCQTILNDRDLLSAKSFVQHSNTVIASQTQSQFEDHVPSPRWSWLCLGCVVLVSVGSVWQGSMGGV